MATPIFFQNRIGFSAKEDYAAWMEIHQDELMDDWEFSGNSVMNDISNRQKLNMERLFGRTNKISAQIPCMKIR